MDQELSEDWPLFLYEYDAGGRYGKPVKITNANQLRMMMLGMVSVAVEEKREVRITDTSDFLVYHSKGGEQLWPKST